MSRNRRRWYTVFLGSEEVHRCLAQSEKEALDEFHGACGFDTLEEFCAEQGLPVDELIARAE